jgi:hypothetical protein
LHIYNVALQAYIRAGGEAGKWERFERLEGFEKWEK